MSKYISNLSSNLAEVLEHALRAQPAQFAGYWANIEFWFSEYEHLMRVAAGYEQRYSNMKLGFDQYVAAYGGPHNLDESGAPYQGVARSRRGDLSEAVNVVKVLIEHVIERAQRMGLIEFEESDTFFERVKSLTSQSRV